jgi:hypothetical protein
MGRLHSALGAFALSSGLAAHDPRTAATHASHVVTVLATLDRERAELVVAVLDNARLRMEAVRRSLEPVNDATTRLVMDAAFEAIRSDACHRLEDLIG